ncbi:hypothetical protein P9J79_10930, partial [Glaesserella parasuis]|uniref:hypothetical protein n=1 Tax=Glaesserella parasuis TaxID=738 RepID=UPI0024370ADB
WGNDIPTKMLFLQAVTFPQNFATPTATLSQSVKHNWVALLPDIIQWRSHSTMRNPVRLRAGEINPQAYAYGYALCCPAGAMIYQRKCYFYKR